MTFALDKAENPHPKMLAGARAARDSAHLSDEHAAYWNGYLRAMADATGCTVGDLISWMERA